MSSLNRPSQVNEQVQILNFSSRSKEKQISQELMKASPAMKKTAKQKAQAIRV